MKFYNTFTKIPPEHSRIAVRLSNMDTNEMYKWEQPWDFDAKRVTEDNKMGVFMVDVGMFLGGFDGQIRYLIMSCDNYQSCRLLIMQYDERKVIKWSASEVSVTEANILKVCKLEDFADSLPGMQPDAREYLDNMIANSTLASMFMKLKQKDDWVELTTQGTIDMFNRIKLCFPEFARCTDNLLRDLDHIRFMMTSEYDNSILVRGIRNKTLFDIIKEEFGKSTKDLNPKL